MQGSIQEIAQSAKIAAVTSATTIGSGTATWLEWIPGDIGKLVSLVGLLLSAVLIYTHLKKSSRDQEKHDLEMKILKDKVGL